MSMISNKSQEEAAITLVVVMVALALHQQFVMEELQNQNVVQKTGTKNKLI